MGPERAVAAFGGVARFQQISSLVSRRALQAAVADGLLVNTGGTYSSPLADAAAVRARQLRGVASHSSAAALWQLGQVSAPTHHHVTIPRRARRSSVPDDVRLHYAEVSEAERRAGATDVVRTVVDCARDLPLRDAVAIGDSALRGFRVTPAELADGARLLAGAHSARIRRVVGWLDGDAANPFESALRAILLGAGITVFRCQLEVREGARLLAQCDLGDAALRLVLEAEGFEHHGQRGGLRRDCRRYTRLAARGWMVLRFSWEDVMFDPGWVIASVREAMGTRGVRRSRSK